MFVPSEDAYSICEVGDADLASDAVDECWLWPYIGVTCVSVDWRISAWFECECSIGATYVTSTNSPGQIVVDEARNTRARLSACLFYEECVDQYV